MYQIELVRGAHDGRRIKVPDLPERYNVPLPPPVVGIAATEDTPPSDMPTTSYLVYLRTPSRTADGLAVRYLLREEINA